MVQLTREVGDLRQQLVEQANRRDEVEILTSIEAEFTDFEQKWNSDKAKAQIKDEENDSRMLDHEMSIQASSRQSRQVIPRYMWGYNQRYLHV